MPFWLDPLLYSLSQCLSRSGVGKRQTGMDAHVGPGAGRVVSHWLVSNGNKAHSFVYATIGGLVSRASSLPSSGVADGFYQMNLKQFT